VNSSTIVRKADGWEGMGVVCEDAKGNGEQQRMGQAFKGHKNGVWRLRTAQNGNRRYGYGKIPKLGLTDLMLPWLLLAIDDAGHTTGGFCP